MVGWTLFDTVIGRCGIAWSGTDVVAVQLPEARDTATRDGLLMHAPAALSGPPPVSVEQAIKGIVALLRGDPHDLSSVALHMSDQPAFHQQVYRMLRTIGPGQTRSYGEVATALGVAGGARAVGRALSRNPFPIIVPCHRVLAANGKLGGFSANGGVATKARLLAIEQTFYGNTPALFAGDARLGFDVNAAVAQLRANDPAMARLIESVGRFGLKLSRTPSLFVALAEAIVAQQLNGKAAATIFARLCALFPHPQQGPTAEQIARASDEKLRSAGLSGAKVLALRDLARRSLGGELPSLESAMQLDDEALITSLTRVRGIGRWTVEMLLIFRLGRPDVLPLDDYGIKKGFAATLGLDRLPTRTELATHGVVWSPYRSVASWYLWRAAERNDDVGQGDRRSRS